jgi:nucleoside-diphosphate-sugar epimerase
LKNKTISILGCGWLGTPLAEYFIKTGYHIRGSTTSVDRINELSSKGIEPFIVDINKTDSISKQFLNSKYFIASITSKSAEGFKNLIKAIEKSTIQNIIFVSATSVYKKSNRVITEDMTSELIDSPLLEIEKLFLQNSSFTTTILRFAGLFGYERKPGNFFRPGKFLSDPEAYVNLIHRDDCIRIIEQVIVQDAWNEIFNCCVATHPTKREFYTKAATDIGRSPPEFSDSGRSDYKIINNEKLKKRLNYTFKYNDLMKLPENIKGCE